MFHRVFYCSVGGMFHDCCLPVTTAVSTTLHACVTSCTDVHLFSSARTGCCLRQGSCQDWSTISPPLRLGRRCSRCERETEQNRTNQAREDLQPGHENQFLDNTWTIVCIDVSNNTWTDSSRHGVISKLSTRTHTLLLYIPSWQHLCECGLFNTRSVANSRRFSPSLRRTSRLRVRPLFLSPCCCWNISEF